MKVAGLIIGCVLLFVTTGPLVWWLNTRPPLGQTGAFMTGVMNILSDSTTKEALIRSLAYSFIAPTLQTLVAILIALSLSKKEYPAVLITLLLAPLSLSGLVAALCWKALFVPKAGPLAILFHLVSRDDVSLLSGRPLSLSVLPIYYGDLALLLLDSWIWMPIMAAFFTICLRRVPHYLVESATIEGASTYYRAIRIEVPYIASYIAMAFVIRWTDAFRLFDGPWTLFGSSSVISYFSARVFSLTVIPRDTTAALSLALAGIVVTLPAFLIGSKIIRSIVERVLHDD